MNNSAIRKKRKNLKNLTIDHSPFSVQAKEGEAAAAAGGEDANKLAPGTRASYHNSLTEQLATLEIGFEYKLDLRAEDLQTLDELGSGNGGTVTKVLHVPTRTVMAKKVIHIEAKPTVRKQILRELQILHDCSSKHIVSFYGAYLTEGDISMCMEYMDSGSLDSISKHHGAIEIEVLGKITVAVVEGLTYLYNVHRIIHRDVKPSNILINSQGQIKICDFGVSGQLIDSIADTFVGTSTYMSPERIQGAKYSVKSDVWSLGITLMELALGHFPFPSADDGNESPTEEAKAADKRISRRVVKVQRNGNQRQGGLSILDLLNLIVHEPAPALPKSDFRPTLCEFIDKCLIKDPAKRPAPQDLLTHPFIVEANTEKVDLETWAQGLKRT